MNEVAVLAGALAAGIALGLVYFWGLWMTVKGIPGARHPALMMASSFILRNAVCVAGFLVVSGGHWERLLAALVGFVAIRMILIRSHSWEGENALVRDKNNGNIAG